MASSSCACLFQHHPLPHLTSPLAFSSHDHCTNEFLFLLITRVHFSKSSSFHILQMCTCFDMGNQISMAKQSYKIISRSFEHSAGLRVLYSGPLIQRWVIQTFLLYIDMGYIDLFIVYIYVDVYVICHVSKNHLQSYIKGLFDVFQYLKP